VNPEILRCIDEFLVTKDPLTFQNPFVWTTVKPLVDLLESDYESVKLLGTFLAVVTTKSKTSISTLFLEGAVKILTNISKTYPNYSAISKFSLLALHELGITPEIPQNNPSNTLNLSTNQDITSWLEFLQLSEFLPIFQKNQITWEIIPLLTEKDLAEMEIPLGPRKKLFQAIQSIIGGKIPSGKKVEKEGEDDHTCLVCCERSREICFVPCGHVIVCETCASILKARGEVKCVICRRVVERSVKTFYI